MGGRGLSGSMAGRMARHLGRAFGWGPGREEGLALLLHTSHFRNVAEFHGVVEDFPTVDSAWNFHAVSQGTEDG